MLDNITIFQSNSLKKPKLKWNITTLTLITYKSNTNFIIYLIWNVFLASFDKFFYETDKVFNWSIGWMLIPKGSMIHRGTALFLACFFNPYFRAMAAMLRVCPKQIFVKIT